MKKFINPPANLAANVARDWFEMWNNDIGAAELNLFKELRDVDRHYRKEIQRLRAQLERKSKP